MKKKIAHFLILSLIITLPILSNASINILNQPDIKLGNTNSFVKQLQTLLNANGFIINNKSGQPGSQGFETTYFGEKTKQAIINFQNKYNIKPANGYVGIKTKTKIQALLKDKSWSEISKGKPVAYGEQLCSSITHYSITWTFDKSYPCGSFANGEPWVVGPVTVTGISPNPSQSTDGVNHGSMVNPNPNSDYGFDSRPQVYGNGRWLKYDPALNAALKLPLILNQRDVLVSTISLLPNEDTKLKTVAALTVMESTPPEGSFRPSIFGPTSERAISNLKNVSQINWLVLKNYTKTASTPSASYISKFTPSLPWFEWSPVWNGHNLQARDNNADGTEYGRETSVRFGVITLWLNTNQLLEDKKPIAINVIQNGLDIYNYVKYGGGYLADGGHKAGRKLPVVVAAMMLNDNTLKTFASDPTIFQEDQQTFFVTQADVDRVHELPARGDTWYKLYNFLQYTTSDIGIAEWGIRHYWAPFHDNSAWNTGYRDVVSGGMMPAWLAAYVMGAQTLWNHPAAFEYMKRNYGLAGAGGVNLTKIFPGDYTTITKFTDEMYKTYGPANTYGNQYYLSVRRYGTGGGEISGLKTTYKSGETATIKAIPDSDSVFVKWENCPNVSGDTCTMFMNETKDFFNPITATFDLIGSSNPPTISTTTPTTSDWIKIASEDQSFTVPDNSTVRYGALSSWITKIISGTGQCTNAFFGSDPLYGTVKTCEKSNATSTTLTTPTITSPSSNQVFPSNTTTVTVSWSGDATNYLVRVDDLTDTTLNTDSYSHYVTEDVYTSKSINIPVKAGHSYKFWVHSGTMSNYSPEAIVNFSVSANTVITTPTTYTLTASKTGTGTGSIIGISQSVTTLNQGDSITLTAQANTGSKFTGWGGDCSGTSSCVISNIQSNKVISANFDLIPTTITPTTYVFNVDLKFGMTHPDVKLLQKFLNNRGYTVAKSGSGSLGNETEYFGKSTQKALIKYQTIKAISPASGYFGPATREVVNNELLNSSI